MVEDICYKRNYLTNVIARFDFSIPIPEIGRQLPKAVADVAKSLFPIPEPKQSFHQELKLTGQAVSAQSRSEFTTWFFHGKEREKTLIIQPDSFSISFTTFDTYLGLRKEFLECAATLSSVYKDMQGKRLGLRYINEIHIEDGDPLDWGDYLAPRMLGLLEFHPRPDLLSRVFHNLELNCGTYGMRFQFGIPNPDFPATIRKKIFVIDLDAYSQGPMEIGELPGNLDTLHNANQELFELSITQKLRDKMNE